MTDSVTKFGENAKHCKNLKSLGICLMAYLFLEKARSDLRNSLRKTQ